ncbi:DUF305 domain-containing protein [Patescibacteria group bacterium]|nr:DUF305 domain-containing protein [Patescibacteria group bacterium]MBU2158960.1 DUF305 domain-containing protein [Patescibacteria group bacterium]MBU2220718.1 DUF305 domain-containing protein [Patescibacteria group bacterium]
MNTKIILAALIGLIVGVGGAVLFTKDTDEMPMAGSHMMSGGATMNDDSMGGMHDTMNGMMVGLEGKTGDEFDQAFLAGMIVHHEGAVEMAKAALTNAKHEEIKQMANAIISAQNTEIKQMQDWQKSWYAEQSQ